MKNKSKGFTLIELLAVIIILAVIGLIIFPSAIESINNSKQKLYKEQIERILEAADSWASSHDSKLPNEGAIKITVEDLQKAGLLKHEDIKNPMDSSKNMAQDIAIYFDSEYNQYISYYCDSSDYLSYYYNDDEISNVRTICSNAKQIS